MVIGIVGAGLAGLAAGRILARAGHEVTIFEKSGAYGGRMASGQAVDNPSAIIDYGLLHFEVKSDEFRGFTAELLDKKLIQPWGTRFAAYDGEKFLKLSPNTVSAAQFTSTKGMSEIVKYLSRWVDIHTDTKVGGLTYFGTNRSRKRSWMMNLTSSKTFEADAVILALPAPEAYGILATTIDETNTLKIVRQIDEVSYRPGFSLVAGYGSVEIPEWEGVMCKESALDFVSNESIKRDSKECMLVLQASDSFTKKHRNNDKETIAERMLAELAEFSGGWAATPEWHQLHYWPYQRARKVINSPFLELEDEDAPLALIGDYFGGNSVDDAYRSAYLLADNWANKI